MDSTSKPLDPKPEPVSHHSHKENLLDHYWEVINYQDKMIRSSEVKAGLILTFYGIILNIILWTADLDRIEILSDPVLSFLIAIWLVLIGTSLFYGIKCFAPILMQKGKPSIIFFNDIITKYGSIEEFSSSFYQISMNQSELFSQLGHQVYTLAKIASIKFSFVRKSISFLAFSLVFLILILLYVAVLKA